MMGERYMGLSSPAFEIGDNLPYAVHSTRAYGIEKLCRELRKYRANATTGHDFGSSAPEKIGELSHPIEVRLQPRQKNEVIFFCLKGIEWAVPVLVIEANVEIVGGLSKMRHARPLIGCMT